MVSEMHVVALTGFMGAGKTSVGHALAALIGWRFVDLDQEIEQRERMRIAEIFQQYGEAHFRQIESAALRHLLDSLVGPTIIALGGGTFVDPGNAELLLRRGVRVIFLHTPVEELLQRCRVAHPSDANQVRPLAQDPDDFRALYAERLPRYQAAQITLLGARKTVQQMASEIARELKLGNNKV